MSRQSELAELSRIYDSSALSNRNLIINGSMQIDQRGSQTVNSSDGDQFGPDRFRMIGSGIDQFVGTIAQDSDSPTGFGSSFKLTTTTAETAIDAAEYFYVLQSIEANTLQALKYGTSSAEKVTLSFHVKSSVTGTFGITLYKVDNTGQIQTKTYTISSASTWEYKTVTFDANTLTGGAINNDTGEGLQLAFHLAAGSNFKGTDTSSGWANYSGAAWAEGHAQDGVITTLNATWQITGVQLEIGDTATPFEHRSVGDELARCQRYYQIIAGGVGIGASSTSVETSFTRKEMRAAPAGTTTGTVRFEDPTVGNKTQSSGAVLITVASARSEKCQFTNFSGLTSARPYFMKSDSGLLALDAEI